MPKNKIYKFLKVASPSISLATALICALTFGYSFDAGVGYFKANHPLTYIFYAFLALSVIASVVAAITSPAPAEDSDKLPDRRIMGIILMCSFALFVISFILMPTPEHMVISLSAKIKINLYTLILVCAIASVIHFGLLAFSTVSSLKNAKILTGIAPIATVIAIATASYLDLTQAINSPIKLLSQFALVVFALYYVLELRCYTPVKRRKLFIAVSGISIALSLCGGVAMIYQMLLYSGFSLYYFASAIMLATMASCTASKLLEP